MNLGFRSSAAVPALALAAGTVRYTSPQLPWPILEPETLVGTALLASGVAFSPTSRFCKEVLLLTRVFQPTMSRRRRCHSTQPSSCIIRVCRYDWTADAGLLTASLTTHSLLSTHPLATTTPMLRGAGCVPRDSGMGPGVCPWNNLPDTSRGDPEAH